jgi:hypothetical protein
MQEGVKVACSARLGLDIEFGWRRRGQARAPAELRVGLAGLGGRGLVVTLRLSGGGDRGEDGDG